MGSPHPAGTPAGFRGPGTHILKFGGGPTVAAGSCARCGAGSSSAAGSAAARAAVLKLAAGDPESEHPEGSGGLPAPALGLGCK